MDDLPLAAVIGWLVHEKYGGYDVETKLQGLMQRILPEHEQAAEDLKELFKRLPEERVREHFAKRIRAVIQEATEVVADRESNLFFNAPIAVADVDFWSRAAMWSVEEAAALTFGRNPYRVNWAAFKADSATHTSFAVAFIQVVELINRSVQAGLLLTPIRPRAYLEWCRRFDLEVSALLVDAVERLSGRVIDWYEEFARLSEMYDQQSHNILAWQDAYNDLQACYTYTRENLKRADEREIHLMQVADSLRQQLHDLERQKLSTRERESMLKLIVGMAVGGYGYDVSAKKNEATAQIATDLDINGVSLSDDTVRKYLKEATELMPAKAEQDAG